MAKIIKASEGVLLDPFQTIVGVHWDTGGNWFSVSGAVGYFDDSTFGSMNSIAFVDPYPVGDIGLFITPEFGGGGIDGIGEGNDGAPDEQITLYDGSDTLPLFTTPLLKSLTTGPMEVVGYINHTFGYFPIEMYAFGWWTPGSDVRTYYQLWFKTKRRQVHLQIDSFAGRSFTAPPVVQLYKKGAIEAVAANGTWNVSQIDTATTDDSAATPIAEILDSKTIPLGDFANVTIDFGEGTVTAS